MATAVATVRKIVDDRRVLAALLRSLTGKKPLHESDLDAVHDVTIQRISEAIPIEAVTVFLLDAEGRIRFQNVYYSRLLYGQDSEGKLAFEKMAQQLLGTILPPGQGIVGRVIETGKPAIVQDVATEQAYDGKVASAVGYTVKSMLTVPLVAERPIGAIQLLNKHGGPFHQTDLEVVEKVAEYSARVIRKVRDPQYRLSEAQIAVFIARLTRSKLAVIGKKTDLDVELLGKIGEDTLRRTQILPLKAVASKGIQVAMADPLNMEARDLLEASSGLKISEVLVAQPSQIEKAIERAFPRKKQDHALIQEAAEQVGKEFGEESPGVETVRVEEGVTENSSPIVQLATRIVEDAHRQRASDIHIEPGEREVIVRYRVDGILQPKLKLPPSAHRALVSRFKIMANLDIAEKRLPQDGRIMFSQFSRAAEEIDLRVSTAPLLFGEKLVMRILDRKGARIGLEQMGFSAPNLARYREWIQKPYGMILHVGPTGSGKTTTLYSALSEINSPELNIQTAEDPVEYQLAGINQMQMNREIGLTFANALRCFLRQDPDIIMVGEMRDRETAEIGIEAALTGHLLFSTLHTNDAAGTVVRFLDMGIEPFLVSSSLLGVCAQRLMRRLCPRCREKHAMSDEEKKVMEAVGIPGNGQLYRAKGCDECGGSGYRGRTGTHELLSLDPELKELVNQRKPAEVLQDAAVRKGMIPLYQDALSKVREGITSLEEALSTVRAD